jgi:undecaprenyl-diphosphatase
MSIFQTIILGIVQGVTEWFPVSSSGHLVLFEHWLDLKNLAVEFDIFLHLASLLVVIIFFRKQIWEVLRLMFKPKSFLHHERQYWGWYILLSTGITGVLGWMFYQQIDGFRNPVSVAGWLIFTSLLLLATAFRKEKGSFGLMHAIVLGFMQGLAVLPGVSRSGVVIAMALILGLKKRDSFDYAFLLAIPAIAGSAILTLPNLQWQWIYGLGFLVTAVVGYLTLGWLKKIIDKNYFHWFFIYTLILALIIFSINY